MKNDTLPTCPLCGGEAVDIGHGISCRGCCLWLGDGTKVKALGGYRAVWCGKAKTIEHGVSDNDSTKPGP